MRDKGIRAAISAVLIAAAVSIPSAGLCARANSPGCEAVFSVICEEGYEKDVEFLLTDEETGEAVCDLNLDEDEVIRFSQHPSKECPFYKDGDEYKTVRHQM